MRRVNIEAAFLGEGGVSDTGDEEGLALSVRGGEIVLVLPAGTPEARAVEAASMLRIRAAGIAIQAAGAVDISAGGTLTLRGALVAIN